MKIAYFDCIAGASGDMILGALVDAGLPFEVLQRRLAALKLDEFELRARKVVKNGFSATKVDVVLLPPSALAPLPPVDGKTAAHKGGHSHLPEYEQAQDHSHDEEHAHEHQHVQEEERAHDSDYTHDREHAHVHGRHLGEIESLIRVSDVDAAIQEGAIAIFRRLAEAEAGIHNAPVEGVHLHEVGGVDTIVDVVGALVGLDELGVGAIYVSPLPLGRGFVKGAHGQIPLPAPATTALLKGVPIQGSTIDMELVTPTGAVLLTSLARGFGPIPPMTLEAIGYGAGGRDLSIPNVMRVLIGENGQPVTLEKLALLESNIDDNNPEVLGYVMEKLLAEGALDVFFTPIQMKKNRPAVQLSVLCRPEQATKLESIVLTETSTLGIRRQSVERSCLKRSSESVETAYGPIRVKIAHLPDGSSKRAPEYEDCKAAAIQYNVPLRLVYEAVG